LCFCCLFYKKNNRKEKRNAVYIYDIRISCIMTTYQQKLWYSTESRKICCTRYQQPVYLNIKTLWVGSTILEYLCLVAVISKRLLNITWKGNWNNTVGINMHPFTSQYQKGTNFLLQLICVIMYLVETIVILRRKK
jgi:hypothetical protein